MTKIFVEERQLNGEALTWDLAHHLFMRYTLGPVLIVAEKPIVLMAALRKQWLKIAYKLRNEYSRTLSFQARKTIQKTIHEMETLPFIIDLPRPQSDGLGIFIVTPTQIADIKARCTTIYVADLDCSQYEEKLKESVEGYGALIEYSSES